MKRCSQCKETKSFTEFYKNRSRYDGFQNTCKKCYKQNCINNKESRRKSAKRYYQKYQKKFRSYARLNDIKNKERRKIYNQSQKTKEMFRISAHKYRRENPEKIRATSRLHNSIGAHKFPQVSEFICFYLGCDHIAEHYHHWNYKFIFSVIPLCITHHAIIHRIDPIP